MMQDTSLFTVSQDSIALSIRYNLRAITLSVPQEFSSLKCLAEALSGNCCQKRRARTRFDGSAAWWVIYFETCCRAGNAHVGANERTRSRTTNLPLAAVRCCLVARKDTRIIYMHAATLILDSKTPPLRHNDNTDRRQESIIVDH